MDEEYNEQRKRILLGLGLTIIGIVLSISVISIVGSEVKFKTPVIDVKTEEFKKIKKVKVVDTVKVKEKKKKITVKEAYKIMAKNVIIGEKKAFLSIDDNGKPCYLLDSKFVSSNGDFIPYNYIPENFNCEDIVVSEYKGKKMIKIDSLDQIEFSKKTPIGYTFHLQGEGIDSEIELCDEYWSDNCSSTPKAKYMISLLGPSSIPIVTNMETLILTKLGLEEGISEPSIKYHENENFYVWRKVPFSSPYAYKNLIDGEYVNSAKEAYLNKPQIAIDLKSLRVYIKDEGENGICYYNKDSFPINSKGEVVPVKMIPPKTKCESLRQDNGYLLLDNLDSVTEYVNAKIGTKVKLESNKYSYILEKCGKYWADSCKDNKTKRIAITSGDRSSLPFPKNKNRISLSKKKGKAKTNNQLGITEENGYYLWKKAQIQNSVHGMIDLNVCDTNCYNDEISENTFMFAANRKLVKYMVNRNNVGLWISIDGKNILSPTTNRWSSIINIDRITGVSKDGIFYTQLRQKYGIIEAKEECLKKQMRLPSFSEISVENNKGIYVNDWSWTNKMIDDQFYTVWKGKSLMKSGNEEKFNVICVEH